MYTKKITIGDIFETIDNQYVIITKTSKKEIFCKKFEVEKPRSFHNHEEKQIFKKNLKAKYGHISIRR